MPFTIPVPRSVVDLIPKSPIVTPHAAVIVWNYLDRLDSGGVMSAGVHKVAETIIGTESIVSISTSKRKSSAAGSFEIRLAPTHNWVSRITPGSWCAILMSQDPLALMTDTYTGTADKESFKMLGRIESVRGSVEVNPETGARVTTFIATGQDWGAVFNSTLYFDQSIIESILKNSPLGQAYAMMGKNLFAQLYGSGSVPTATQTVDAIIDLWGLQNIGAISNGEQLLNAAASPTTNILLGPKPQFQLPKEAAAFMRQTATVLGKSIPGTTSVNFADIIKRHHGRLTSYDDASDLFPHVEIENDARGVAGTGMFMGNHSLWQLLNALCNNALYELVTDIRWVGNEPQFALYHRIRPFITKDRFSATTMLEISATVDASETGQIPPALKTLDGLVNLFQLVRRTEIKKHEVIGINFGTNAGSRINFIEVKPDFSLVPNMSNLPTKIFGQTADTSSFERDGFHPLFVDCNFIPFTAGGTQIDFAGLTHWKYLLREWHFNTHTMLDGTIAFIGQSSYIQVGDNIMVDVDVLGDARFNAGQADSALSLTRLYMLAHVENIMHEFSVNQETGARTFITRVQFVRGIITDQYGNTITNRLTVSAAGAIDGYATPSSPFVPLPRADKNSNTVSTVTNADPHKVIVREQ